MQGIKNTTANDFFIQNKSYRNTFELIYDHGYANGTTLTVKGSLGLFKRDVFTNVNALNGQQKMWYTEIAYNGRTKSHTWVLGGNFNGDDYITRSSSTLLLPSQLGKTIGIFAQDDWKMSKKLDRKSTRLNSSHT